MARLPTPGSDNNSWGTILNDFMSQAHNSDGTLKASGVTSVADAYYAKLTSVSQANGIAALDGNGLLPSNQIGNPIAAPLTDRGGQYHNVKAYGAIGNGTTNDTAAIQSAITAAQNGNGVVYFPAGTYLIATGPLIIAGTIQLCGSGWKSVLKLANGTNTFIATYAPPANTRLDGVCWRDLQIDCNGANQTAVSGGINAANSSFCRYERLQVVAPWDFGIQIHDDGLGGWGHHNVVTGCHFYLGTNTNGGRGTGLYMYNSDENLITNNVFESNGSTLMHAAQLYDTGGLQRIIGNVFVANPNVPNVEAIKCTSGGNTIQGNIFDGGTNHQLEVGGDDNVVTGNTFYQPIANSYGVLSPGGYNVIASNIFVSSSNAGASAGAVNADSASGPTLIVNNLIHTRGSWNGGLFPFNSHTILRNNIGHNPVGRQTAPSIPTSNTPFTNPFPYDCTVYVTGGTVSGIAVAGSSTGLTSGTFRVSADQSITLTYSSAPSWQWFGE